MTIAVDWEVKNQTKPPKNKPKCSILPYEVASRSDILQCIKINEQLVQIFGQRNEMLTITMSHIWQSLDVFTSKCDYKII